MIMGQLKATKTKCSSTEATMMSTMLPKACCMRRSCALHSWIHTMISSEPLLRRLMVVLWLLTHLPTALIRSLTTYKSHLLPTLRCACK